MEYFVYHDTYHRIIFEIYEGYRRSSLSSTFHMLNDNITTLRATILPPPHSLYASRCFYVLFTLPPEYPLKPPALKFITPILHLQVDPVTEKVCLDLLEKYWTPSLTLNAVVRGLEHMLGEPNPLDFLNEDLLNLWKTNKPLYEEKIRKHTETHGIKL